MIGHAKGLLCAPMSPKVAEKLGFRMMVEHSTDPNQTPFTISTDGEYHATGVTTGVSAFDRAATLNIWQLQMPSQPILTIPAMFSH